MAQDFKPEYKIEMRIVDTSMDEEVIRAWAYLPNEKRTGEPVLGLENLSEEAAETEFWDMMRHFRNGVQEKYEAEHYSSEVEEK